MMTPSEFTIEPITNPDRLAQFVRSSVAAFSDPKDADETFPLWLDHFTHRPDLVPDSARGVFDADTGQFCGGYLIAHRSLNLGPARLRTGCIGAVVVEPQQRKRGIASVLMRDAIRYAQSHRLALLLLTGIPNFYHRFGFVPVMEELEIHLNRETVAALPEVDTVHLRQATLADAETLLALYRRQFQRYTGSFDRSLPEQEFWQRYAGSNLKYLLAYGDGGDPLGYLMLREKNDGVRQEEMAATDWPVIAAFLHEHYRRLALSRSDDEAAQKGEIPWRVLPDSPAIYHLAEHIPFRSERLHHFSADWMARPGDLDALVEAMLPAWSERVQNARPDWRGLLNLRIGQRDFTLQINETGVHRAAINNNAQSTIVLTEKAATQLCFGFRPVSWFAGQPNQQIPLDAKPLLNILFPKMPTFVAASDYF